MDLPALYDDDLYAWAMHQAEALRRLKASSLPLPNDLDLEHVAEEIEDLGRGERLRVESNLVQALIHIGKLAVLPSEDTARHWSKETRAFLSDAADHFTPSMRRALDLPALWRKACRRLRQDIAEDGHALPPMPDAPPFSLDDLLDEEADPRALAARLAALIASA